MKRRFTLMCQVGLIVMLALTRTGLPPAWAAEQDGLTPVVVELFTSQGCSSCPPADALLSALARNQPVSGALIIPLSEHVDYWNRLGWHDPFSSRQFSERQATYVRRLQAEASYTPMMVVEGRQAFVGSQPVTARKAILSAVESTKARLTVTLASSPDPRTVCVSVVATALPDHRGGEDADVWVAVTESAVRTEVTHGENAFRTLTHTGVVRSLERIGSLPSALGDRFATRGQIQLGPHWPRANLRVVAFLQERASGRILGAAQKPLP